MRWYGSIFLMVVLSVPALGQNRQVSGVYPHLAMWNKEGECGTGAVVAWANRLWVITYGPHKPTGSSDKLYEITPDLKQIIRPESVGGTPANRMIHRESNQLNIGPYLIDAKGQVRVIGPGKMPGRLTGSARHLFEPEKKIYIATMEEGLYSLDVYSLEVTEHIKDGNRQKAVGGGLHSKLPGYHGKGLYAGQGRLVYANNGTRKGIHNPASPSGALAEWFGKGDWQLVRRNQFTEVTGPGGIHGNAKKTDPVWSMGWDHRSLILMCLDAGRWHAYRLPKGSHSYDGSHGWNTEWPRIRDIGEKDLLATMHGTFWRFPRTFSSKQSAGIAPRSNYLKVVGDFCRRGDRIVLGCDDSAKSEFLNTRPFKAKHGSPLQSNSNLWFIDPKRLDQLGPVIGRGSVWLNEPVRADTPSEPYLFAGYDRKMLHLRHTGSETVTFTLEVDRAGDGTWQTLRTLAVSVGNDVHHLFKPEDRGAWIRLKTDRAAEGVTAAFHYSNHDRRTDQPDAIFAGWAEPDARRRTGGVMRSLTQKEGGRLGLIAVDFKGDRAADRGYYELTSDLRLVPGRSGAGAREQVAKAAQPGGVITLDAASVVVAEEGRRYRLPVHRRPGRDVESKAPGAGGQATLAEALGRSIAIGAKVTAHATFKAYAPAHVVDGRMSETSRWVGPKGSGGWVALDLGKPKTFQTIAVISGLKQDARYALSNFQIQIQKGDQWHLLPEGRVRGNRSVVRVLHLNKPVTAQRIRLLCEDEDYARVYEIGLWNKPLKFAKEQGATWDLGTARLCREVATERDLLHCFGTFFELPARNAQGMAKIRPVASHGFNIHDFCSWRGLLAITGVDPGAAGTSTRVIVSEDGTAAVWLRVID
ncbi:MAG: discoidin domain-containing protein [Phycisphaeraceae bacterium]|nr:discoidin domain-containing protein [Phycisphaeraceae bacterium]